MNEVVSESYTLAVQSINEGGLPLNRIKSLVNRLLELARFPERESYYFEVTKPHSSHQAPTLEFEHYGNECVNHYRCRVGNIAGLKKVYNCVLHIPDRTLHSGINDELNAAAVKLLAEIQAAPPSPTEVAVKATPEVSKKEEVVSSSPVPPVLTLVSPRPAPSPPPPAIPTRSKKRVQRRQKLRKKEPALTENFGVKLAQLKKQVAAERTRRREAITRLAAELLALDSLQLELEELELKWRRQLTVHDRLKNL